MFFAVVTVFFAVVTVLVPVETVLVAAGAVVAAAPDFGTVVRLIGRRSTGFALVPGTNRPRTSTRTGGGAAAATIGLFALAASVAAEAGAWCSLAPSAPTILNIAVALAPATAIRDNPAACLRRDFARVGPSVIVAT